MFSEFENPLELKPAELDQYLAEGWRPMGQSVYTCHFSFFGSKELYSTLCIRLPLNGYEFRKSLRKLMRRNDQQFQTVARPAVNTQEKELLNQVYRRHFTDKAPNSLRFFLGEPGQNLFPTYEIAVYDQGKLVALSFFDVGNTSMYSKMGIYDPSYKKYSLGFYTMLKEIEFGLQNNKSYYYPGYVTPFYPMFDYKLRIGRVEYLDLPTEVWRPYNSLREENIPVVEMKNRLSDMQQRLKELGIRSRLLTYRYFDIQLFDQNVNRSLRHPMFLLCDSDSNLLHSHIIIYHPVKKSFHLYRISFVNEFYNNAACHQHLMAQKDLSVCEYFFLLALELESKAQRAEEMILSLQEIIVK